ncbi:anhydro-N-acetylmuramic acid kinase [Thiobacter aerophilum]|uniref:Anhydro-N-acetylmuramic acid kinase n=1 Tax=Thiobacter aerophilum TaxID=3121275 RepID=A0ABV0EEF7_9BURK
MAAGTPPLVIGLMSGTSLDGVDAVLGDFSHTIPKTLGHVQLGFDPELREELLALNEPGPNELERAALAANRLAEHYTQAVKELLAQTGLRPDQIAAIGAHGQTVRHRPELGYTLQLNNPALLAERTGIRVVADFRSRDLAAGGQGAPLVPAFHAAVFSHAEKHRVIVNIGGIANLTDLPPGGNVTGFDCGPGNLLMDAWCQRHTGQPYDVGGSWAASGTPLPQLLAGLLDDPFFRAPPPKSTGRDHFNLAWLEAQLSAAFAPQDVQATLLRLTAQAIHDAVQRHMAGAEEIWLCGGGARNTALVNTLRHAFAASATPVALTDALGVAAEWVEALAFAWLAWRTLHGAPGNLPAVTGATHPCVLGAIYPR